MKTTNIYILIDPRNNDVRYVGKSNSPRKRLSDHCNNKTRKPTHKTNWIRKLKKEGVRPELHVVDVVPIEEWQFWEAYWIEQFKNWGYNLTNSATGGGGITYSRDYISGASKVCEICGSKFKCKPSIQNKRKTCSMLCTSKLDTRVGVGFKKGNIIRPNKKPLSRPCSVCGSVYKYTSNEEHKRKTCSNKCSLIRRQKAVIQMDLSGNFLAQFDSIPLAEKSTGVPAKGIRRVCNGEYVQTKGFKWKYKDLKV